MILERTFLYILIKTGRYEMNESREDAIYSFYCTIILLFIIKYCNNYKL